ncbi:hypothetical protein BXZ70DRAFT_496286 [Cristinia sonorae]|uniref:Uncharacterized protein n=1 Tax=Cristinia sonorae TaxID=1940300 RepID=A0A8K0UGP0_9AGAR|nr:hypothetical protein BXZ70DRAFT_496286 [Cristinia sonorae]
MSKAVYPGVERGLAAHERESDMHSTGSARRNPSAYRRGNVADRLQRAEHDSREDILTMDEGISTESAQSATLSIFFAGLCATLLQYVQSAFPSMDDRTSTVVVYLFLYLALVTSIGSSITYSTLSTRSFIYGFGRRQMNADPEAARKRINWKMGITYFSNMSLNAAMNFLFVSIVVFVWSNSPRSIAIAVSVVVAVQTILRFASFYKVSMIKDVIDTQIENLAESAT